MAGYGSKFSRKMEEAVAALMTQRNIEEAARSIGIGTQTLMRWMKEPAFQIAYREARRAALGQSSARAQQAAGAALSTLVKIMLDSSAPASARVRAANSVLDYGRRAIETEDIQVRMAKLEQAAKLSQRDDYDQLMSTATGVCGADRVSVRRKLDALEKGFITEPTILTMPDGSTVSLTGPADYLAPLFGSVFGKSLNFQPGGTTRPDSPVHGGHGAWRRAHGRAAPRFAAEPSRRGYMNPLRRSR